MIRYCALAMVLAVAAARTQHTAPLKRPDCVEVALSVSPSLQYESPAQSHVERQCSVATPPHSYGAVVCVAEGESTDRVLIDTTVTVDGNPQPIKVLSVRASRAVAALCPLAVALSPYAWLALLQGQDNADVAKNFALEHKLDQEGMQNVYYFLNRKAAEGGFYKKKLDEYLGFEYAGEVMPITIFEDTKAKGVAEFLAVKLNLVRSCSVHPCCTSTAPRAKRCGPAASPSHVQSLSLTPYPLACAQLAEASVALQGDIERFIISKVVLRMPVDLTEQGLGTQYVVVKRGETVDAAMQRFASSLKSDFGFAMNDKGIFELKSGVTAKIAELQK